MRVFNITEEFHRRIMIEVGNINLYDFWETEEGTELMDENIDFISVMEDRLWDIIDDTVDVINEFLRSKDEQE